MGLMREIFIACEEAKDVSVNDSTALTVYHVKHADGRRRNVRVAEHQAEAFKARMEAEGATFTFCGTFEGGVETVSCGW